MQDVRRAGHGYLRSKLEPCVKKTGVSAASAEFKKSNRLLNSEQFKRVLRKGKKSFNPVFLLFILPNNHRHSRLGITVSKKVSRRAVDRNRIKRQVREFFRTNQNTWPGYDVVMIANPQAANSDNEAVQEALRNVWFKAGQYINN